MRLSIGLTFAIVFLTTSCRKNEKIPHVRITGETMGTYYRVVCDCKNAVDVKQQIDSLLIDINNEVSTYIEESLISQINQASVPYKLELQEGHFSSNLKSAQKWYRDSDGYMDVSIMPLVNYWGFGYTEKRAISRVDSLAVDSLKQLVGLDKWDISDSYLTKKLSGQEIDFSALAKGYAVDRIGDLLSQAGATNFLVDIGGELLSQGKNENRNAWTVGISKPDPEAEMTDVQLLIQLEEMALASSGNYRNYYEVNGQKYGHTLNPKSGFPYQDQLLAISVIAGTCMDADAIATASMAMGYSKAITFIQNMPEVSACLLVGEADGSIQIKYLNGFIQYVIGE